MNESVSVIVNLNHTVFSHENYGLISTHTAVAGVGLSLAFVCLSTVSVCLSLLKTDAFYNHQT